MSTTSERTVTAPYIDHRTATTKRTPDWIVTIKQGAAIQVHRFSTQERAQGFYEEQTAA